MMTRHYHEPFRPQFHYSPPQWWANDPNGVVYYEGEYHLFFQYNPDDVVWGPMHWGHAVSPDLIHWETLPIALYPDDLGTIFSGTVVVDAGNTSGLVPGGGLVALYSYNTQTQGIATSTDRGRTWQKYAGNPILQALAQDFRDPKVFWDTLRQQWVMVIAAGQSIMIFVSPNLIDWTSVSSFNGGYVGGVWEVPDLFPLTIGDQTKWILLVSVNPMAPAGGSGTRYFIGDFDGTTFTDENPEITLWLDYGPDNYAGSTWNNAPDGRRVFLGWMNNWLYGNVIPTSTWRGAFTIPRELSLISTPDGIRLAQTPIDALKQLRQPIATWEAVTLESARSFDGVQGQQLELIIVFNVGTAATVGVELFGPDDTTHIVYDVAQQSLIVTRPDSGIPEFQSTFSAPLTLENSQIRLHVFVDHSSVEVFVNDGVLSLTCQVFPSEESQNVRLFATGGSAQATLYEAFALKSIWE